MEIIHEADRDRFIASTGDWVIDVFAQGAAVTIVIISQRGDFTFNSGINLDNLATFIVEVKADCVARGLNWSGN